MEKLVSRNKSIAYIVVILAVLFFLFIWPFKYIRTGYTAKSDEIVARESDPISVENNMAQMFEGIGGELTSVELLVCNDMSDQIMTFRMYDENHAQIFERFVSVEQDFIAPGFVKIPIRYDMEAGKEYSFIIEGLTTDLYAAYEDRNTTTSPVNYFMAYGGAEIPEYDLIVRYNYMKPFALWQVIVAAVCLLIISLAAILVIKRIKDEKQISVRRVMQTVCNPIIALCGVLSFYVIMIHRLFGPNTKNNVFLTVGVWLILLLMFFAINFGRIVIPEHIRSVINSDSLARIIRVISIATVLWYCYEYMNGMYNIFHYYSVSKLVIAFAFLLISTYDRKELLNIANGLWLIIGPVLGYLYYKPQKGVEELGELYRLNGWVIAVGGFVVINLIYSIVRVIRKEVTLPKINKMFAIPFAVFAIGISILANGRYWVYFLVVLCLLLIHRLAFMKDRKTFTKDLCSGIILNFYMMVWFSVRHRPYYFYQFYRYYMGFHTVTVTAYYLAMIMCAAWMRLYESLRKSTKVKDIYPKMFTFGMASTYLIFTMSRTGFLSVGCMLIFALILSAIVTAKDERIKHTLKYVAVVAVSVIYMFPVTFFLTDVMPRISNDPITFEYEVRDFTFTKGMPYADYDYMTIEQFIREFNRKIFNIEPVGDVRLDIPNPFVIKAYASETEEDLDVVEESSDEEKDVTDMSNGRFEIFKSYIAQWNLWGHEDMEVLMPNGAPAIHAHNSFLQVAHDHGIIFGIYFVLFTCYVVILSLVRAVRRKDDAFTMFCPIIMVCFVMASLVEWLLHPCNPFGLTIFMAMMPLMFKDINKEDEKSN